MKPLLMLGKYELLEKIGSGGMAEVYKARLTGAEGFEKVVVVKKILPGYARNKAFIDMLIEEAKLSSVLQHPNIVQTIELAQADSQFYIAMEYVNGRDLLKVLARCAERKATYPTAIAAYAVAEACKGLDYAHRARDIYGKPLNIIHRDVSPSNVILSWSGQVKVMDFGVAKARTQDAKGSKHVLRGKLGYMSPEQVRGEEIDHRSDIFSLGVVLFESLTLKRLFLGRTDLETLINIRDADVERKFEKYPFIEEPLRVVLRRALAQDREKRYATALEFHDDLMEYLFNKKARVDSSRVEEFLAALFGDEAGRAAIAEMPPEAPTADAVQSLVGGRPSTSPGVRRTAAETAILEDMVEEVSPVVESPGPPRTPERSTPAPQMQVTPKADFDAEPSSPKVGQEPSPVPDSLKGHEFRLRNTSGYVFGPVDYGNLVNLIQTGAVSEDEFVQLDGGEWKRVREITAVRSLSPNETLRKRGVTPLYSGTISRPGLVRIFFQVASRSLSGKLRFSAGSSQKEFYFRKGKPRHIASNLKHELLGSFLLHREVVSEEQMNLALEKARDFGGKLGDALVSLGYVKPHELYSLLDQQFRAKFLQVFAWTKGSYEFFDGVPCPIDMAPADANVYRYVLEGIRKHATAQELEPMFRQFGTSLIREKRSTYVSTNALPLTSKEQRLWTQTLKIGRINEAVATLCKKPEEKDSLYHLLLLFYHVELIEFQGKS